MDLLDLEIKLPLHHSRNKREQPQTVRGADFENLAVGRIGIFKKINGTFHFAGSRLFFYL